MVPFHVQKNMCCSTKTMHNKKVDKFDKNLILFDNPWFDYKFLIDNGWFMKMEILKNKF